MSIEKSDGIKMSTLQSIIRGVQVIENDEPGGGVALLKLAIERVKLLRSNAPNKSVD